MHRPSLRLLPSGKRLPINGNSVPIQPKTPPFKNPCPSSVASCMLPLLLPLQEPQPLRLSLAVSSFLPSLAVPPPLDSSTSMAIEFISYSLVYVLLERSVPRLKIRLRGLLSGSRSPQAGKPILHCLTCSTHGSCMGVSIYW